MDPTASTPDIPCELCEIGGYRVLRSLVPGQSWLATAAGGRKVVLKLLDDDCLWKNQLHPSVRDRLGRVRELAHTGVANLHGVERDSRQGLTFLIWEYLEGRTLLEAVPGLTSRELHRVLREVLLSIDMLHARGIIHGAIKAQNVILTPHGGVALTHISPLLYTEVAQDEAAVGELLDNLIAQRGMQSSALARSLATARAQELSLRQFAGRIGALLEARDAQTEEEDARDRIQSRQARRRTLTGALAAALMALAVFGGLRLYAQRQTPQPPTPVNAPPAAMQDSGVEKGTAVNRESR